MALKRVQSRDRTEALQIYQLVTSYPDVSRAVDHRACGCAAHNVLGHFARGSIPFVDYKCVCLARANHFAPDLLFFQNGRRVTAHLVIKHLCRLIYAKLSGLTRTAGKGTKVRLPQWFAIVSNSWNRGDKKYASVVATFISDVPCGYQSVLLAFASIEDVETLSADGEF